MAKGYSYFRYTNPKLLLRPRNVMVGSEYYFIPVSLMGKRDSLEEGSAVVIVKTKARSRRDEDNKALVEVEKVADKSKHTVFLEDLANKGS